MCDMPNSQYTAYIIPMELLYVSDGVYVLNTEFRRINSAGNGVGISNGVCGVETHIGIRGDVLDNVAQRIPSLRDVIQSELIIPETANQITIKLSGGYSDSAFGSVSRSDNITIPVTTEPIVNYYRRQWFNAEDKDDVEYRLQDYYKIFKFAYAVAARTGVVTYFTEENTQRTHWCDTANTRILYFYAAAKEAGQTDPDTYTWFQWQYAILTCTTAVKTVYKTPAEAEAYMRETYPEIVAHYEGTEEGGDAAE